MKKKEVLNNIGFFLIVAALLVILVFQKNIKVVVFAASFGLLIYGLMSIPKNNVSGIITCVFSISLAVSGVLYFTKIFNLLKAFTFMISCTVFFMMVLSAIFSYKRKKLICSKYTLLVDAEVVDLVVNPNTEAKYYQPQYKYTVDGEDYYVLYPSFINKRVPNIGDKTKLRVDENDKDAVYFERAVRDKVFDAIMIVFFMLVALAIMIGQFL